MRGRWLAACLRRPWTCVTTRAVRREQKGAVLALAAIMMVAMMGFAGLVIDGGRAYLRYREAQNTADAAALAAVYAIDTNSSVTLDGICAQAKVVATQNNFTFSNCDGSDGLTLTLLNEKDNALPWASTSIVKTLDVQADVTSSLPTVFARVLGLFNQSVTATARARVGDYYWCELCVLDPTASSALNLTGGGGFTASNVKVVVNSNNNSALNVANNAALIDNNTDGTASVDVVGNTLGGISAQGIDAFGNVTSASTANITGTTPPAITTGISPVPDPLAGISTPSQYSVNSTSYSLYSTQTAQVVDLTSNSQGNINTSKANCASLTQNAVTSVYTCTLLPGLYGNITDNSGANLIFSPGVYIITGCLCVNGSGNVTATDVMMYFTCTPTSGTTGYSNCTKNTTGSTNGYGYMNLAGNGTVTVSAMTSTDITSYNALNPTAPYDPGWAGMFTFYDRLDSAPLSITGNGSTTTNSSSAVSGTIYAKVSATTLAGSGSLASTFDSLVVVDTLKISGSTGSNSMDLSFNKNLNEVPKFGSGLVN